MMDPMPNPLFRLSIHDTTQVSLVHNMPVQPPLLCSPIHVVLVFQAPFPSRIPLATIKSLPAVNTLLFQKTQTRIPVKILQHYLLSQLNQHLTRSSIRLWVELLQVKTCRTLPSCPRVCTNNPSLNYLAAQGLVILERGCLELRWVSDTLGLQLGCPMEVDNI